MEGVGTFALGVAAALVAQAGGPGLARRARPLLRGALKQAILLGEGVRVRTAEVREDLADLAAEAREEAQQVQQAQAQQARERYAPGRAQTERAQRAEARPAGVAPRDARS